MLPRGNAYFIYCSYRDFSTPCMGYHGGPWEPVLINHRCTQINTDLRWKTILWNKLKSVGCNKRQRIAPGIVMVDALRLYHPTNLFFTTEHTDNTELFLFSFSVCSVCSVVPSFCSIMENHYPPSSISQFLFYWNSIESTRLFSSSAAFWWKMRREWLLNQLGF